MQIKAEEDLKHMRASGGSALAIEAGPAHTAAAVLVSGLTHLCSAPHTLAHRTRTSIDLCIQALTRPSAPSPEVPPTHSPPARSLNPMAGAPVGSWGPDDVAGFLRSQGLDAVAVHFRARSGALLALLVPPPVAAAHQTALRSSPQPCQDSAHRRRRQSSAAPGSG